MHGLRTIEKLNTEHQQAVTILTRQVIEKDKEIERLTSLLSHYEGVNNKLRQCQYLLGQINSISDLSNKDL